MQDNERGEHDHHRQENVRELDLVTLAHRIEIAPQEHDQGREQDQERQPVGDQDQPCLQPAADTAWLDPLPLHLLQDLDQDLRVALAPVEFAGSFGRLR